ncbi:MAG: AbrB/MazE/SpoVT family DNA-binding domain-containing protein [Candidatus Thermoplasmatota archaeon]|jgi:AbrB family looped-hinge helix DNA binding protein|nr:AbrB/MazE/SpoVT family DNA-binding domain-containing protein [Candidatus Sysuiplasma jiujiangense]MBX8639308.1 AbrB/MazE/SpoVT family DNA-binding domain-containing protein [Candidatus Sysuiplasma jiujiangense]MBX8641278.1 AbrB/MazE/SpoVT family DNA-binding domain-containing protein [Candidatus Sysuiplasma jiujiangense]MCL4317222.1 AbrB/MazE/SpoVT family DNA-binding domain-containing protein [Candidatus Thermoplasmatota archaeon]
MEEIAGIDRAGRIVIPKEIRKAAGIDEGAKILITISGGGRIILQKLDVKSIAARLEKELEGKDIDEITSRIRKDVNALIRKAYPVLSP